MAHCLEGDILTVGATFDEALGDLPEALAIALEDAIAAGVAVLTRRAPDAGFARWHEVMSTGEAVARSDVHADPGYVFATQLRLRTARALAPDQVPFGWERRLDAAA